VFYFLYSWTAGTRSDDREKVIRVTAADVNRFDAAWRARWNRPPTEDELAGALTDYVREIALYRHAVAMGLDQNDAVVRRTVGQKLRTLTRNFIELNLAPTDEELIAYFEANEKNFRPPDLTTFSQVFIDPDRRGDATLQDAEEMLNDLRSRAVTAEDVENLGDSFMLPSYFPEMSELEIAKLFGQGFAESVFELSQDVWHGPVLSGYGVHLVFVHHRQENPPPEFGDVRDYVAQEWVDNKRRELEEQFINSVVSGYEVIVDDAVPDVMADRIGGLSRRTE